MTDFVEDNETIKLLLGSTGNVDISNANPTLDEIIKSLQDALLIAELLKIVPKEEDERYFRNILNLIAPGEEALRGIRELISARLLSDMSAAKVTPES